MNPLSIKLPDLGLFSNLKNADLLNIPPTPIHKPVFLRQQSQFKKKNIKKYFRYHELMDTIKYMKQENKKLRAELQKFGKKYLKNT